VDSVRITSKGQVTIPQQIRERLGLFRNTQVEFELDGDSVRIRRVRDTPGRGEQLVASLRGRGTVQLSTDDILALTRPD
jgi:AbrB family looped-hinge helix DNA binding protein